MKGEFVQFLFVILAIVVAAAAEELLPTFGGVGFPFLLSLTLVLSPRLSVLACVMMALGAGAFEDSLSSLPPMTAACFFTVAALVSRMSLLPLAFLLALFPLFELWAVLRMMSPMGDVFARMLVSLPLGAVALGTVLVAGEWTARKAGLDG